MDLTFLRFAWTPVQIVIDLWRRRRRIEVLVHRGVFIHDGDNSTPPTSASSGLTPVLASSPPITGAAPEAYELGAEWLPATGPDEYVFVWVVNHSPREVEVTHIWFDTQPQVHLLDNEWPLPARLRTEETYETWYRAADLPQLGGVERLARVKISTWRRPVHSIKNKHVPPRGAVATRRRRTLE